MSGGVDSSVAALLMRRAGYEVVGMTAELFGDASAAGPCCGKAGICMAGAVCEKLGIEHHQVDLTALFEAQVIERFLDGYEGGRTPNPCADCNRFIKFDAFFNYADQFGCELLATGHYARTGGADILVCQAGLNTDRSVCATILKTGLDPNKDQSYFLACIPPERLARVRFPIGELTKPEVRELASDAQLPTATRKESQDICFMGNGVGIAELLSWHRGRAPQLGRLVDDTGRELGVHRGVEHYTIGQRRGLNLGGGTEGLAVQQLDPATNTVVLAQRGSHPVRRLVLSDFADLAPGLWCEDETVTARGRYRQPLWNARVQLEDETVAVEPLEDVFHMAPGQWCVGYDGDTVLFGGIIRQVEY
jgi:tRNA-specific 2-thiouridylase